MPKRPHPVPDPCLPGQESVWSFPRPSIAQPVRNHLKIIFAGRILAETTAGIRTIETSHPPTYYFPPGDVDLSLLRETSQRSVCEWKGEARYFDVVSADKVSRNAAWSYPHPTDTFRVIKDFIAFYPQPMDECLVDGESVVPQAGPFYGGWITSTVAGPFKGPPGTEFW
ncbi:DUF427 domain-containing protein [Rhizobium sp. YIM 134829]|uniref:DUF427 domain-containing protein n=1 Tax=Rhizobium sp. YIM 134829 TaxID=3390453 RepID=UPI00397D4C28